MFVKEGAVKHCKELPWLAIGANMRKILAKIVMLRLNEAYETNIVDSQLGMRRNRSTTYVIFVLTSVIDKYNDTLIAV